MGQTRHRVSTWLSLAVLLAVPCAAIQTAIAADLEREQLAAVVRQIELADRLAEQATRTAPQERARYHFDYARLHADLERVRAGLQDYLVPQRAQPRDPVPLTGDYVRRDERPEASP
jgi:RAQPRD family integrative conjugative element protein